MGSSNETETHSAAENASRIHFVIDAKKSRFTVQAFAAGILSAMGHSPTIGIRAFSGDLDLDPETIEASGLRLTIQALSLEVQDDISDKDCREMDRLMKGDVLEVARYPEIRYEASPRSVNKVDQTMYTATLSGNLTFHGISRPQPVPVRISLLGEILRASGEFTLRQSDYQVKPISVAGGALKLKDELKFSFEVIARKSE
jgi:polyisoprenoid-binding protein YceI